MLIMVTAWYPPNKNLEVTKKYLEVLKKYPAKPFEKALVRLAVRSSKKGVVVISIAEAEKGKFEEAFHLAVRRMVEFNSIEGYRHKIETFLTEEEAFMSLGLTPPK
jgi:hypothetical protein